MSPQAALAAVSGPSRPPKWAAIDREAPVLADTALRYLTQLGVSARPSTVESTEIALRRFCWHLVDHDDEVAGFVDLRRDHIESYKAALSAHRTGTGRPLSANTVRMRLGMVRTFIDRIIEWDWEDAPARNPIYANDVPAADEPLPRFLDDSASARFVRAAGEEPDQLSQLAVELLARTGMRIGELCALEADAVTQLGERLWLRIPVGKLHNNRYVPLHPRLVELLSAWLKHYDDHGSGLLLTRHGRPLNRYTATTMVRRVAKRAGLGRIHPHQLRHTLATQALNRGMRLEAVAALLGHRDLKMTLTYARIADRTVGDQYQAASEKMDALYAEPIDGGTETPAMRRLAREHQRMLGNGWCTRPTELDCHFEAICEGCGFFATTVEFLPRLTAQRDHAARDGQIARQQLYDRLIHQAERKAE